ncbi:MAG: hypothetical protein LC110_10885, partial [Burkholderiales bacterium]|nr:hypothetical protein [Burkholderiales bacterium]
PSPQQAAARRVVSPLLYQPSCLAACKRGAIILVPGGIAKRRGGHEDGWGVASNDNFRQVRRSEASSPCAFAQNDGAKREFAILHRTIKTSLQARHPTN